MLRGGNLIVLGLSHNAEFPELFVKLIHKRGYSRFYRAEIMIVHLLTFRRLRAKQCSASKAKVGTCVVHFFRNKEIFLLRTYV